MPLFYQHNIDEQTRLAVWRIEEEEAFFLQAVPLHMKVSHPYKRLQHLAGRYLLSCLDPAFPIGDIVLSETGKPMLPGTPYQFSVAHCGNYAAAIISTQLIVGIDVELTTPRMRSIAQRFLHASEQQYLNEWESFPQLYLQLVTVCWSAKEAIFKWYGEGQVDFKKHSCLNGPVIKGAGEELHLPFLFRKGKERNLEVHARIFDPLVLAWVAEKG